MINQHTDYSRGNILMEKLGCRFFTVQNKLHKERCIYQIHEVENLFPLHFLELKIFQNSDSQHQSKSETLDIKLRSDPIHVNLYDYRKSSNLATNDGDGWESFPKRHPFTAMISEDCTSSLDFVNQTYQTLHRRHFFSGTDRRFS